LPAPLARVVDGAIEMIKASPAVPPHQAIEESCRAEHVSPPVLYRQVPLTMVLESYLRNLWRYETLDALDKAGVSVRIYGNGWEFARFENHVLSNPVDYDQSLELVTQSKMVLNVSPQFFSGSHERVLDAALNGTACLTSRSSFLAEVFPPDSEMSFYDVSEPSSVVEQARSLLDDDARRVAMAKATKLTAGRKHTWQVRAEEVVDAYQTHVQMRDILGKLKTGVEL
jgi:hypothetical protein